MTAKENNAIAVKFFETAWNEGKVLEELLTPDALDHSTVGGKTKTERGAASFKGIVGMFRAAMPDAKLEILHEIYSGDMVVHRWSIHGTHTGAPLLGVPPTGKQITLSGTTTVRFENNKIAERWANVDELGLLQQLNLIPPPPNTEAANKLVAYRYFKEIMNEANIASLYELISPNFVFTLPTHPEPYHGPDGFKQLVLMLHGAIPDFYIHPQDIVAQGDTVVTRWIGGGTHLTGPIHTSAGDIPPTGKFFEINGMTWHRMEGGKIVESLANEDTISMLEQIGIFSSHHASNVTTPEQNIATVHRYFHELAGQGKVSIVEEIMHPEVRIYVPNFDEPFIGHEGTRSLIAKLREAFPDIEFEVDREVAEDHKVAVRWYLSGTQEGEFMGYEPSGEQVRDYGIDIFHFKDGKIIEVRINKNDFGIYKQIGVLPS
jgi:predicted ester cyclase